MYLKLITKTKKIVSDSYFTIKKKKKKKSPESKRIPKSIRFVPERVHQKFTQSTPDSAMRKD